MRAFGLTQHEAKAATNSGLNTISDAVRSYVNLPWTICGTDWIERGWVYGVLRIIIIRIGPDKSADPSV